MRPRFSTGDAVRVDSRDQAGHVRTPWYIRGKRGVVLDVEATFPNPESLAEGGLGLPYRRLYRVLFRQEHVWPDYRGTPRDTLVIDIYEHWLEPA